MCLCMSVSLSLSLTPIHCTHSMIHVDQTFLNEDVWDDTALIAAYEESISTFQLARQEEAKYKARLAAGGVGGAGLSSSSSSSHSKV